MKERETAVTLSLVAVMDKSTELNTITRRGMSCSLIMKKTRIKVRRMSKPG